MKAELAAAETLPTSIDDARRFWERGAASAGPRKIWVYVGSAGWSPRDDVGAQILVHEAFHVLQMELAGAQAVSAGFDAVPAAGPVWLEEGTATYVAYKALAALSLVRFEEFRAHWISRVRQTTSPLRLRETRRGLFIEPYQISTLAVDFLVGTRSDARIVAYYEAIGRGEPWQAAFAAVFGKSVDTFYAEFEAYRAGL